MEGRRVKPRGTREETDRCRHQEGLRRYKSRNEVYVIFCEREESSHLNMVEKFRLLFGNSAEETGRERR